MLTNIRSAMYESVTVETFEAAALPHLNDLYRHARHVIGNPTEAEDVVQETYHQAWKSFHRFTPGTNCRAWLFRILFHVISHHRRKWLAPLWHAETDETVLDSLTAALPLAPELKDEDILAALDDIPPQFRVVILLADVEEFTYQEIADMLQIPIGTVMSRLSRGRKLLAASLAGVAVEYGFNQMSASV